jgi:polyferredoxin
MIALGKARTSWKIARLLERRPPTAVDWSAWLNTNLNAKVGRKGDKSFRVRVLVQAAFAVVCVLLGAQFSRFVAAAHRGAVPLPHRPPGVEGFLPISGMMGVVDWVRQGTLNTVHPAATMIFLFAVALAILLRKSFCSWICPVGFLSEALARLGRKTFGRNFRPWKVFDIPLRGLKYLLLAFFGWAIFHMDAAALRGFIDSPYNRVADVKTGMFFVELGTVGITVVGLLAVLSVLVQGAWCRYLCPYGALLGLFSWFSPTRIERNPVSCIDCGLCDKVCMSRLPVSRKISVLSPECTGCLDCIAVCPIKDALGVKTARRRLSVPAYAAAVLLLFLTGYFGARAFGLWNNGISDREYVERIQEDARAGYVHPM